MSFNALLSVDQMARADALTIEGGTPGIELMENAGRAVTEEIIERWSPRKTVVACGPGNNGGDGFVIARLLSEAGWPVTVSLLGQPSKLTSDAKLAAERWSGRIDAFPPRLDGEPLIVDALFGAGLSRDLGGDALGFVRDINRRQLDCVGVDMPSGVQGDSGAILGDAPKCCLTVTFFRAKPAHVLMPARTYIGELVVADIGIDAQVLNAIRPHLNVNGPALWSSHFPVPDAASHKFNRGHLLIAGGDTMTGAALLAARGARRIGAGLVTIASSPACWPIYASDQPGNLVKTVATRADFEKLCADQRINGLIIGPGFGLTDQTKEWVLTALKTKKPMVLDADGISAFAGAPGELIEHLHGNCVVTPHEGEFARIFESDGDKLTRAKKSAEKSGAIMLIKGADTVIAAPSGEAVINRSGTPYLATAGSGDVLAGLIGGLLAQGMVPFHAACCAAWSHGAAAEAFGPGLIAEDLPEIIPKITGTIIKLSLTKA